MSSTSASSFLDDPRIHEVMDRTVNFLLDYYADENGHFHMPTLVGAAAAMTGEFTLLACHLPQSFEESGFIISPKVDAMLFQDHESTTIFHLVRQDAELDNLGYVSEDQFFSDIIGRTAAQFRSDMYPAVSVPQEYLPLEWSPNANPRFRGSVNQVLDEADFSPQEKAWLMALVTGEMIAFAAPFVEKGLADLLVPREVLVLLAMEIIFGCARIPPIEYEI